LEDNPESRNGLVRNDKKCKSRIVQRIHDAQLQYVKGEETAYDIWKSLKDVFETKGMTSRVMLKTKLLSLKHQPSEETLSEHFLKFDKIVRELEGTGCIMDDTDKVCHLHLSMSAEYEMTVTALRTLPEKDQKLAMVKNHLLEEETKRMTVRRIMRPKVNTDTVTVLASRKSFQQSKWKEEEGPSSFPFNCYNCGMKGHKRRYCRKPAQYSGNHHGSHHSGNQQSGRLNNGSNYGGRFHGNRQDGNKSQTNWRNQGGSAQCAEKASSEGGAGNPYTFIAETGNNESYLSTKKTITWVLDSGATDHLVKEDTHMVNKYELPVLTMIHIAKNDIYWHTQRAT
jgi:hypothetical protein